MPVIGAARKQAGIYYDKGGLVFNAKHPDFGAKGDDATDDTAAIIAANAFATTEGGRLHFPAGIYRTSANLSASIPWVGLPWASIIKPSAAVTKCIDLNNAPFTVGRLSGIWVDGVLTNGATGVTSGETTLTNLVGMDNCQIWNFKGVGARGLKLGQVVTGDFTNCYICRNYINLHTNGGNTPTDTIFHNSQFREATTKGVWIETGYGIRFLKPLFEANGEEGIYFQNAGGNAIEIEVDGGWSEANWLSLVGDPVTRATKYSLNVDGDNGPSGTIRVKVKNHKYDGETAKAMRLQTAIAFLVDACHVPAAGGVKFDIGGNSYGTFINWPEQNGAFKTKVSMPAVLPGVDPSVFNARQRIEDQEAGWTPWVPAVTGGGAMTISSLVITKARYKIVGKRVFVKLSLSFTTGGAPGAIVLVTLPPNVRTFDANEYPLAWLIDNGVNSIGYARGDGTNPTSFMYFGHFTGNWALAAGQAISFFGEYELF